VHEFGIAQALIGNAVREAQRLGARRIGALHIRLGAAHEIMPETMELCLEAVSKGTPAEGARWEIEWVPVQKRCVACDCVFQPSESGECPSCGAVLSELMAGNELYVDSLEID
jgi:hydrogenase nickel incorporation protein HypA/HybF